MRKIAEEIYQKLSGIGDTYHNMLLPDPDVSGLLIVYELHESGSYNTLDLSDYANDLDLTVKLLHPDSLNLLEVASQVKALFLNQPHQHNRGIDYNTSVPIFWDPELRTNQYTLLFSVYRSNVPEVVAPEPEPDTNVFSSEFSAAFGSGSSEVTEGVFSLEFNEKFI